MASCKMRKTTTTTAIATPKAICCLIAFALLALLKQTCQVNATSSPVAATALPPAIDALQQQQQQQLTDVALATKDTNSDWQLNKNITVTEFEQTLNEKLSQTETLSTRIEQHQQQQQQLLSRKRRYLLFPEGSSFQLVYDLIIGIVDYTNYLVMGVTMALAWELPSKAPSEILADLQTKLLDGNIDVSRIDSETNLTYVQTPTSSNRTTLKPNYINMMQSGAQTPINYYYKLEPMFRPPMHQNYYYGMPDAYYRRRPPARRKDSYYYKNKYSTPRNPFNKWIKPQQSQILANNKNFKQYGPKYPWWQLASRLSNSLRPSVRNRNNYYSQLEAPAQRRQDVANRYNQSTGSRDRANGKNRGTKASQARQMPPIHRIYPVFGKRSTRVNEHEHQRHRHRRSGIASPELSKLDRIHIRHHRSTRQALYDKIENYLDKHKLHGHHCVLRALCETGQKSNETEPTTFIGELLRTVFTLPEALDDEEVAYRDTRYDQAQAHTGDCAATYHLCTKSMWEADFIK